MLGLLDLRRDGPGHPDEVVVGLVHVLLAEGPGGVDLVAEARARLGEDVGQRGGALLGGGEDVLDVDDRHRGRDGADVADRALGHAHGALHGALLRPAGQPRFVALDEHRTAEDREAEGLRGGPLGRDGGAVRWREPTEVGLLRGGRQPQRGRSDGGGPAQHDEPAQGDHAPGVQPADRPGLRRTPRPHRSALLPRAPGSPRGGYPKVAQGEPSSGVCRPTFSGRNDIRSSPGPVSPRGPARPRGVREPARTRRRTP